MLILSVNAPPLVTHISGTNPARQTGLLLDTAKQKKKKTQLTTLKAAGSDHRGRIACRRNRKCQKASHFLWPRAERWAPTNVLSADQNRALASRLSPVSSVLGFPVAAVAPGPSGPAWKCRENIHFGRDEIVYAYWGSREPCQIHSIWQLDLTYLDSGESVFPTCSAAAVG